MLAFHAPPEAVIAPVTQAGKIAGMMSFFHNCQPLTPMLWAISRKSVGTDIAPAIVLNRMYHWAPNAISRMLPQFRLILRRRKTTVTTGNTKLAGNEARNCTIG